MSRLHIRWMIRCDMPKCLEIERLSFDDPWTEEEFLTELRKKNVIGMVVEKNEEVVGYFFYQIMRGQFSLINFAVHPCYQRLGVGSAMIAKMLGKLSNKRPNLHVVVNERWLGCQQFLRSTGFKATKIISGEFGDDDGYEMTAMIVKPAFSLGGGAA